MRMAISNRTPEQIASEEESPNVAPVHHLNYTQGLILFGIPVEARINPVKKEANREEALKITTNMVETLKKYPPAIKTNLIIKKNRD